MKKTLSFILSLVMVLGILTSVPLTVNAASVDDLTFELNEDGTDYVVTDCNTSVQGELVIPNVHNGLSVVGIGSSAFENCSKLTSIIIPDSVNSVGSWAFAWCSNLISVMIPDSVTSIEHQTFRNCTSLTTVTIGYKVKNIGNEAFINCSNLSSVIIPDSVISIGNYAFCNCNLTSIIIPNSVTTIGNYAFMSCNNLASVTFGNSVTSVGEGAFLYCDKIMSVTIPNSVTSIGASAFSGCTSFCSIEIPSSVESIGDCALGYYYDWSTDEEVKKDDFTIYGVKGTAAETYANVNGFTFIEMIEECLHTSTKWITDKKATVNAKGSKHKECTECGEVLETAKIAQLKCSKPKMSKISNTEYGVKITWGKVSGADKYYVYRKTGSKGKYSKIGSTTKTYYTDKKASSGKKYYYYVKAVNEAGSSSASSSKSIYHLADTTLKTPSSTKKGVSLKWSKVTGADGYMVYRKTGSGSYSKIATVKGNSKVTYTDKKAKKGKTYTYKIKAYKSKTYSAYSNTKTIKDKY